MSSLEGRVALVTGGASGLGRASALAFAREGAKVVVADVDDDGGVATAAAIEEGGGEARFVRTDVTDQAQVEALVAAAVETYGGLDCAHNNAGTSGTFALTADHPVADWESTVALNLTSVFLCMKAEIPVMLERGGGSIVNTASGAGLVGFAGLPAYVASKHGVVGLTKATALEYARQGIRVNAVCPGTIRTPMLEGFMESVPGMEKQMAHASPIGRLGRPDEVAEAVVWLCSDAASYMVGHALAVDGGAVAT